MDDVLQVASLVAALAAAGPASEAVHSPLPGAVTMVQRVTPSSPMQGDAVSAPLQRAALRSLPPRVAPGEDKFRHAAASWAVTVFAYSAARAAQSDGDDALVIALPITAAFGIGKEIADHRRGGDFSVGDLVADAIGAGAAWLVLREVR